MTNLFRKALAKGLNRPENAELLKRITQEEHTMKPKRSEAELAMLSHTPLGRAILADEEKTLGTTTARMSEAEPAGTYAITLHISRSEPPEFYDEFYTDLKALLVKYPTVIKSTSTGTLIKE
jgi:hypothetical protein